MREEYVITSIKKSLRGELNTEERNFNPAVNNTEAAIKNVNQHYKT
jgi:hypothetical protein